MCFSCVWLGQYADPVADLLDQWGVFRARLFRESCVFHRGNYVKDLSRLGRELQNVIIVDNSPASYIFHPENAVSSQTSNIFYSHQQLLDYPPTPTPHPAQLIGGRFSCSLLQELSHYFFFYTPAVFYWCLSRS